MTSQAPARPRPGPGPAAWLGLGWFGLTTVLFRRRDPIIGSLIVTDRCNLACRHCAVANLRRVVAETADRAQVQPPGQGQSPGLESGDVGLHAEVVH